MKSILFFFLFIGCLHAQEAGKIGARLAGVAPIARISTPKLNDPSTWVVTYAPEATAPQRAAAQAVIDGWTDDDWKGAPAKRKADNIAARAAIQTEILALERERDEAPEDVDAIVALIDEKRAKLATLRAKP